MLAPPFRPVLGRVGRTTSVEKDIFCDVVGDTCCGVLDGVSGEVGVAGGRLDLGVAEELRDHRQALAERKRACLHSCDGGRGCERRRGRRGRARGSRARRCWRAAAPAWCRESPRGCPAPRGMAARTSAASTDSEIVRGPVLLSRKAQLLRFQVHILPAQRQDLVAPAAGEHEQADGGDAAWGESRPVASSSSRAWPKRRNSASVRKRSRRRTRYFWAERQGLVVS